MLRALCSAPERRSDSARVPICGVDTSNPDFADSTLNNGDSATDGSIVLAFGNVVNRDGGNDSLVDGDGVWLTDTATSGNLGSYAVSFTIIFDTDTVIDQYAVSYSQAATSGFQLAGANGTSGLNALTSNGAFAFDMGSIAYFAAGQAYTLTAPGEIDLGQLQSLNISEADVPAPATALLLAGGLLALRTLRRGSQHA